jgi:hypothetical protein
MDTWGSLNFNFIGTWINQCVVEPIPGLGTYDCAGLYGPGCTQGSAAIVPQWKSKLLTVWNTPWNVNVALAWRYISSVDVTFGSSNPLIGGPFAPSDATLVRGTTSPRAPVERDQELHAPGGVSNIATDPPPCRPPQAPVTGCPRRRAVDVRQRQHVPAITTRWAGNSSSASREVLIREPVFQFDGELRLAVFFARRIAAYLQGSRHSDCPAID